MKKKGQVAVFIILALMLISAGAIAFFITLESSNTEIDSDYFAQSDIKQGVNQIQSSVLDCETLVSNDALDTIGIQGGYYNAPEKAFDLGWTSIPYYYKQGQFLMPEKSVIEDELSDYINNNLNLCLETIQVGDFNLSYSVPKTKTVITKDLVSFIVDLQIKIKKENKATLIELKDNPVNINSKLFEMIEIADFIINSYKEDPDMMCVSCVLSMAHEKNLHVDSLDFLGDNKTTLIVISTNSTEIYPVAFEFLTEYKKEGVAGLISSTL